MQSTTRAAILTRAARHIATYGHQKGAFCAPDIDAHGRPRYASTPHQERPADLVGAIRIAATGHPLETNADVDKVLRFVSRNMARTAPIDSDGTTNIVEQLALWNDADSTNKATVATLLHRLAAIAEARSTLRLAVAA